MSHNLKALLKNPQPPSDLIAQIKASPGTPVMLEILRQSAPDVRAVPHTPYTVYREFERRGYRGNYERAYFMKRMQLTRAVLELILGDEGMIDPIHDLVWSICEETSWVLPAHEEQGPDYWELHPSPRQHPYGAHTALTREPDAIDLFAAETGASLAEAIYLIGDKLAPEVVQRARQEVERRIFKPYLAYARRHWWFKGALNWNGVCNGSIALAFLRLEKDLTTLSEALELALEGFEAYIATGFEPDGGSIEGIGYWNYGLVYYTTVAELLKELTGGQLDLLAAPRMKAVANYPLVTALAPGIYLNFGDAVEELALNPGIVQRIAERTGVDDLRRLVITSTKMEGRGAAVAKLAVILRDAAWWDGVSGPFPAAAHADATLPDCAVAKFAGKTVGGKTGDPGGQGGAQRRAPLAHGCWALCAERGGREPAARPGARPVQPRVFPRRALPEHFLQRHRAQRAGDWRQIAIARAGVWRAQAVPRRAERARRARRAKDGRDRDERGLRPARAQQSAARAKF